MALKHMKLTFRTALTSLAIAALAVCSPLLAGVAHASWGVNNQHQLIPLYTYPDWWNTGNNWSFVCGNSNTSSIGSTIIANANNGPTTSRNTDYAQAIEICHDGGHNVIGYVDTSYGAVPLATVKANIDAWFNQYNGNNTGVYDLGTAGMDTQIDGIFLDQVSNFPSNTVTSGDNISVASYYRQIFSYIKSVAPSGYDDVVGNPGATASTDWQLDDTGLNPTQIADELVVFEGTETDLGSYSQPSWVSTYPASDIGMLVYNTPSTDISSVCSSLKSLHAGLVDVTNYTIQTSPPATPWNFLQNSTYWSSFRSSCG
jgi:hypothetical protein